MKLPETARANVEFVVPTGNFGNILAGWLAQQMGLPAKSFRVATNQNDILYRFFTTGTYQQAEVMPSHAPSMDIQAASNFERFLYFLLEKKPARVRETMAQLHSGLPVHMALPHSSFRASRRDDAGIAHSIRDVFQRYGYVVDPHTACGFCDLAPDRASVVLATASPAKFPEVAAAATGTVPTHPSLESLKSLPLSTHPLPASVDAVKDFIRHIRQTHRNPSLAPPAGEGG